MVAYAERFPDHIVERARAQIAAFTGTDRESEEEEDEIRSTP